MGHTIERKAGLGTTEEACAGSATGALATPCWAGLTSKCRPFGSTFTSGPPLSPAEGQAEGGQCKTKERCMCGQAWRPWGRSKEGGRRICDFLAAAGLTATCEQLERCGHHIRKAAGVSKQDTNGAAHLRTNPARPRHGLHVGKQAGR